MDSRKLEIVDENDVVIGIETRDKIHREGLLHREAHVWFMTPTGEIIFQHRAKDKDTYPDLLDATVGGHVEPGDTYQQTAIKETEEETGLCLSSADLIFLKKLKIKPIRPDSATGMINYSFKSEYAYIFNGQLSDLRVEEGKAVGFESWPIDKLFSASGADKKKFLPLIFSPELLELFKQIKSLLTTKQ